jgi:hypothetical protein
VNYLPRLASNQDPPISAFCIASITGDEPGAPALSVVLRQGAALQSRLSWNLQSSCDKSACQLTVGGKGPCLWGLGRTDSARRGVPRLP